MLPITVILLAWQTPEDGENFCPPGSVSVIFWLFDRIPLAIECWSGSAKVAATPKNPHQNGTGQALGMALINDESFVGTNGQ